MDKEKAIMEALYSKYGSILEKYGYKPNKAKKNFCDLPLSSPIGKIFLPCIVMTITKCQVGSLQLKLSNI